jgi:S-adenosylmethionine synthetase
MFGYATDETEECMPLTVVLSHKLNQRLSDLRRDGTLWWACPDTKSQVRIMVLISPLKTFFFNNAIWL